MNPLTSVDGKTVRCPTSFVWNLQDISAPDAGRTEDTVMQKMRVGQARSISLSWSYLTTDEISVILTAFNPEYISVTYLDPMVGGSRTSEFYVGDRSAPMYNATLDLWENVSFNIIERSGAM